MAEMGFTPQRGDSQGRGAGRGGRGALCPLLGTVLRAPTRGRGVGTEAVRPHAAVPGSSVGGPVTAPCVSPAHHPQTRSPGESVCSRVWGPGEPRAVARVSAVTLFLAHSLRGDWHAELGKQIYLTRRGSRGHERKRRGQLSVSQVGAGIQSNEFPGGWTVSATQKGTWLTCFRYFVRPFRARTTPPGPGPSAALPEAASGCPLLSVGTRAWPSGQLAAPRPASALAAAHAQAQCAPRSLRACACGPRPATAGPEMPGGARLGSAPHNPPRALSPETASPSSAFPSGPRQDLPQRDPGR